MSDSFLIEQAFGEIALPGNLTLDFGKFVTTAGAEVIEANKNWLYSRSFLFGIIPFVHTGLRANLKVSDMLTLQGSVVTTGWRWRSGQQRLEDGRPLGLRHRQPDGFVDRHHVLRQGSDAGRDGRPLRATPRFLVDVVGAFTVSSALGLNLNFDYIKAPPSTSAADDLPDWCRGDGPVT